MGRGKRIGTLDALDDEQEDMTADVAPMEEAEPSQESVSDPKSEPESGDVSQPLQEPSKPVMTSLKDVPILTEEQKNMILEENLERILCAPKIKGALPTIVRFKERDSIGLRTVIIDIGAPVLYDAWCYYKANVDHPQAEDFLQYVYNLTKMRIPRLYKVVAELRLD